MGQHKRKSKKKHSKCIICLTSYSVSSSLIPRCCSCLSASRNAICDYCLHRHIFTSISQSATNKIICPEQYCNTKLSDKTIQAALVYFGQQSLWNDYIDRSTWFGTSEEWIHKFSVRCPYCQVPIEKNGGCDNMQCSHCKAHFNWTHAKTGLYHRVGPWKVNIANPIWTFLCRTFIIVILLIAVFVAFNFRTMN